ncbi:hypothetical protein DAKH74_036460 [Maudiozyma humilis]|uniref:PA14 domain-containing protein n=1 Tax=Maudiozyma humilis TaxID=51915 RepID=A0AAV5S051_MAUHU|nr:hypothetical protein DAKH74_036460 [Kazachstania humilis]
MYDLYSDHSHHTDTSAAIPLLLLAMSPIPPFPTDTTFRSVLARFRSLHLTHVWLLVLSLLSAFSHAEALKGACLPQGTALQGLTARFYSYTYGSLIAQSSSAYISGGYRSTKYLGSTTGITTIDLSYRMCQRKTTGEWYNCPASSKYSEYNWYGTGVQPACGGIICANYADKPVGNVEVYGFNTYPTNFTVELTGYVLAPMNGYYTFSLSNVDDAAAISVGAGTAFTCCQQATSSGTGSGDGGLDVNGIKPPIGDASSITADIYLAEGQYYPVKLVYTNIGSIGGLNTTLTLPDGTIMSDWGSLVYSYPDEVSGLVSECTAPPVSFIPYTSTPTASSTVESSTMESSSLSSITPALTSETSSVPSSSPSSSIPTYSLDSDYQSGASITSSTASLLETSTLSEVASIVSSDAVSPSSEVSSDIVSASSDVDVSATEGEVSATD